MQDWALEFPGSVTVCDRDYTVVYMNERAAKGFEPDGGRSLLGTDLRACHKERSNLIMKRIMETEEPNVYTIEKKGVKKLIYQAPWYEKGRLAGLVELSLAIPFELPHFKRD